MLDQERFERRGRRRRSQRPTRGLPLSVLVRSVDRFQRRHPVVGFPLAVVYKYFDDQGPYLAAIIAFYAFIAIFPLLLISTSILGFFLQDDPALRERLLDTALSQFPIVGDELGRPGGLQGSTSAIVIGSLAATYGSLGLGQAAQNAANIAWSVPRNSRTNAVLQRVRSLVFLAFAGLGILALAITSSVLANPDAFGGVVEQNIGWVARGVGFVFTSIDLHRAVPAGERRTGVDPLGAAGCPRRVGDVAAAPARAATRSSRTSSARPAR